MTILGIETSCDETAAAIVSSTQNSASIALLSNTVASSLRLHAKTGGIIPETAARTQILSILPVIEKTLQKDSVTPSAIDAIAVTYGPGLIGSLLVGVETAKTLSYVWKKPLIPVNHLLGHIYANFISTMNDERITVNFPAIALIVSGGHTDLLLMKGHNNFEWLGGTRDDAAGEAFDKIGRLLDLPYPAGPSIEKLAKTGDAKRFRFPRPMIDSNDFDFSFSGLKTAVLREVQKIKNLDQRTIADIAVGIQNAVIDVLITKTVRAAQKYKVKSILLGGGVAANTKLRHELELNARRSALDAELFAPAKSLCTDNAAMIATAAFFNKKTISWKQLTADPELYFH